MNKKYFWALRKCIGICSWGSLAVILLYVINGIMNPVLVKLIADIIDNIESYVNRTKGILFFLGILSFTYLYKQMSAGIVKFLINKIKMQVKSTWGRELVIKKSNLAIADLENEDYSNLIETVVKDLENQIVGVLLSFSIILSLVIEFVGLLKIIGEFNVWIGPVTLFLAFPMVWLSFKGGRQVYLEDKGIIRLTRLMNYFSSLLSDREHINERTLFEYSDFINEKYKEAHLKRSNANTLVLAKWMVRIKMCCIILLLFVVFVIAFMVKSLSGGMISVGVFISLAPTLISFVKRLAQTLSGLIFDIASQCEYIADLNKFMLLKEEEIYTDYIPQQELFESLQINDLSFKYPRSDRYILRHLNLKIEKGKSYSLIGINGAGKSTLLKILTGAYKEYEGIILLNGKDLQSYHDNQLRNIFSLVYQDYSKYQISIKDNLLFGNEYLWDPVIIEKMGMKSIISQLKEKENTILGKFEENGSDLSGGEWQKLVIARALLRKTPVIIMDEPTASLSARMENDFYTELVRIKRDRTLLLISHRMAASKLTDEIIVLDNGQITERGSHAELMQKKGQYFEMFESQRRSYCEE